MSMTDAKRREEETFGKYVLMERVAVGGMAEIFRAKSRSLGGFEKVVAIKRLHAKYSEDQEFIRMLIDEARISVQLNHINIAQVFDFDKIGDRYFISMEYIDGPDLYRVLRRCNEQGFLLPVEAAVRIAIEICHGLDYAHRKRDERNRPLCIVHRDISPQNVLISYEGEVKIIDFGIAKARRRGYETDVGVIKGKFYYMSPEQARGEHIDHRTDIFSAGIVLYEMLTGQIMYRSEDEAGLLSRVQRAEFDPPRVLRADLPRPLERIVLRALERSPDRRYGSALEMGAELQSFLLGLGSHYDKARLGLFLRQIFGRDVSDGPGTAPVLEDSSGRFASMAGPAPRPGASRGSPTPGERPREAQVQRLGGEPAGLPGAAAFGSERLPVQVAAAGASPWASLAAPPLPPALASPPPAPPRPPAAAAATRARRPEPPPPSPEPALFDDEEEDDETTVYLGRHGEESPPPAFGQASPAFGQATPAVAPGYAPTGVAASSLPVALHPSGVRAALPGVERRASASFHAQAARSLAAASQAARPALLAPPAAPRSLLPTYMAVLLGILTTAWMVSFCSHRLFLRPMGPARVISASAALGSPGPSQATAAASGAAAAPTGAAAAAQAPRPAVLLLRSRPMGAAVELDGEVLEGSTPLRAELSAPGPHRLRVTLLHHEPWERSVDAKAGAELRLLAELAPELGTVELHSRPTGAEVLLDGLPVGHTPTELSDLFLGDTPTVTLRKAGYRDVEAVVRWEGRRFVRLELELDPVARPRRRTVAARPARPHRPPPAARPSPRAAAAPPAAAPVEGPAYVTVSAVPYGRVVLDGLDLGQETPLARRRVAAGRHSVRVFFPSLGRYSAPQTVELAAGEERRLFFRAD